MERSKYFLVLLVVLSSFALGFLVHSQMTAVNPQDPIVQVDTITYIDTIEYVKPVPKDSLVIRHKTITDTITVVTEHGDTNVVAHYNIPIIQKEYQDSTYHAWVSGYEPQIDSIYVFPKTMMINTTITNTKYKTKRWGVGVQVGVGMTPQKIQPYIGVGLQYNILAW